jgi:UTP--glucose-1-phosphate uridylyltransferase
MKATSKPNHLAVLIERMKAEDLPQVVIDTFGYYYEQLVSGATGLISEADIRPVQIDEVADATQLESFAHAGREALDKTVMIILNGGLGTSMGLQRAKSLLPVKEGKSFLDIIVEQAACTGVNLAFMNSFNTHADTVAAVDKLGPERLPQYFLQHKFPKILKSDYSAANYPPNPELEWNPPGHGEIYTALYTSGLLKKLISEGVQYALIANADNLGATLEPSLLGYFAEQNFPIMMEVAQRTPADMKGGHLARHTNGRLVLREIAQCPKEDYVTFQDIDYHRFFNTNSIWLNLKALEALIHSNPVIQLPMILNPKTINPRDASSPAVYQIETAMGAAISLFDRAAAVKVPVERFCPVKKTQDLLALRSDCYMLTDTGGVAPSPQRRLGRIQIQLDTDYYGKIDDLDKRFSQGVPSLLECEALTIEGDVYFEENVAIKGSVHLRNLGTTPATIKAGTVIASDLTF